MITVGSDSARDLRVGIDSNLAMARHAGCTVQTLPSSNGALTWFSCDRIVFPNIAPITRVS